MKNSIYSRYIKRLFDIIISLILSVVLIPVFVIVGILIIFNSGFPVIYKQIRVGQYGKKFAIYKFRTMVNGADKFGTSTKKCDSRVTSIGKILRKTSLDELPQIFNVLKGDMSLVGFRPDVEREYNNFDDDKWFVRPGITGYAQVNGRSNVGSLEKLFFWENKYARDISFVTDLKILLKTVKVVIGRGGSN